MGQRLLLVDSDRRFIKDHQVALESAFDVDFSYGTDGVIQRLESGEYAAVLICVEVSENKGYALCSTIRKNPKLGELKIALISAKATAEEYARHQSLKGKADVYLHKPMVSPSLVGALSDLVPPRAMDPDNPLGDLSGSDLGDEWLESLKTELEVDEKPSEAPAAPPVHEASPALPKVPSMATVAFPIPPKIQAIAPSPDAGKVALLEARVKDLEYKLQTSGENLEQKDRELADLHQAHDAATRNLDEMDRQREAAENVQQRLRELEARTPELEASLAEAQSEAHALRERTQELEGERDRLNESQGALNASVDDLNRQLAEKAQELGSLEARLSELHSGAESGEAQRAELQGRLDASEQRLREIEQERDGLAGQAQELEQRLGGLQHEQERLQGVERERDELAARVQELQARLDELQGQLDVASGHQQRAEEFERQLAEAQALLSDREAECHGLQARVESAEGELSEKTQQLDAAHVDVAGLEATLRAQQRELAELEGFRERVQLLEAQRGELESRMADGERALAERQQELEGLQGAETQLRAELADAADRAESASREVQPLRDRVVELEQQQEQLQVQHERQQMELLRGLDEKEALMGRLNATLEAQRDRIGTLECEKQELDGHLSERSARLEALTVAISDLENNIRRASDLTRPF